MSSEIQEIEDFELSLTSNAGEAIIETANSINSAKKSRKTSPIHKHCHIPTPDERKERPEPKWIWCKHCPKYYAQNTSNIRQHLDSIHGIIIDRAPDSSICMTTTKSIEALYAKLLLWFGNSKEDLNSEILRCIVNQQVVDQTLLDLVIIQIGRAHV